MLIGNVVIVSHDAMVFEVVLEEKMVFLAGHAVVHEKLVHLGVDPAAIIQVQGEKSFRVENFRRLDRLRIFSVVILGGFALNENGVGPRFENSVHRQNVCFDNVLQRHHERAIGLQLLVPPSIRRGKHRADEHFIDRCVELHPRETARESPGIRRKKFRKIRILKIADEIRNAEMAKIDNRHNVAPAQILESFIREGPVVASRPQQRAMQRRAVTKELNTHVLHQIEIGSPKIVMPAKFQLIDPVFSVLNGG